MTHLYIEQNTGLTEEVNSSIISKLYELAISGDLDNTSDLKGRLHSSTARDIHVAYLNEAFDDLYINADTLYITFVDPEVERVLATKYGDGTNVTTNDMSSVTSINDSTGFSSNQVITQFPELKKFTNLINLNHWAFLQTTNLTTIDLTNIQHIGGQAFYGSGITGVINLPNIVSFGNNAETGSFGNCANITEVNIGPNFNNDAQYMSSIFSDCTSLQKVTGLSNITIIPDYTFNNCTNLTNIDVDWSNGPTVCIGTFRECEKLEFPNEITVSFKNYYLNDGVTLNQIENHSTFLDCKKLKKIILQGTDIQLGYATFAGCTSLTEIVNSDKIKWVGDRCFENCPIAGTLDLSGCTGTSGRNNGQYTPQPGAHIFADIPNITKLILGGWNNNFASGFWITYDYTRAFFYNCPSLITVDMGIIGVSFPNYRVSGQSRSSLFCACPNLTTLIIRNNSVLSLLHDDIVDPLDIGGSNVTLYVPDAIVNDYKTAAGWSNISNQIKGISELPS